MVDVVARMLRLSDGKRLPIKLDAPTWQAIDWLAQSKAQNWQEWCRAVVGAADEGSNLTASIREAAMAALVRHTLFPDDRGEQLEAMERHTLMRNSGMLNDKQLEEILSAATVEGWSDFGGFAVGFGVDDTGQDCVWVRNGLREGLHMAFASPVKR
ncbi:hypothetical protein [Cupriavidus alkaliphilus]|uniref:Uncharacterized protein n=1 Tax=Cupriavidus alkaliphilus TaxID=942866 RepID=A0A7W4V6C6_9BURK|nr:hypothetical protein [Cupriavidus alkaliphilus]MBB3005809.1 hypothetical protein [Cupriavidus alkaliphilus]